MHVCLYSCLPASISVRRFWMRSVEPGSFTLAWNWLQSWAESSSGWTTWSAFQLMSSSICCLRTGTSRYICRVWTSWTPTYCCHLSNYVYCLWVFQPEGLWFSGPCLSCTGSWCTPPPFFVPCLKWVISASPPLGHFYSHWLPLINTQCKPKLCAWDKDFSYL